MLGTMLVTALAWGGEAPDLPGVLAETRAWRDLRAAEGVPPVSDDAYARVAAGEVVTGLVSVDDHPSKKAFGVAVLDQPIGRVWGAINDESLHPEYTSLAYAELVQGAPCESGRHVLQFLPVGVPLVKDRWWVTIRTHNDALADASGGRMLELVYRNAPDGSGVTSEEGRARMEEGVMVGFTRGSWFLLAIDDQHTLVEYYSWVDPGGSMSPSLMNWFAERSIKKTMGNMASLAADPRLRCVR